MTLTKDAILGAKDLPTLTVAVPEWGGDVIIRTLSGAERDAFEASMVAAGERRLVNIRARLVAACLVDDAGQPLFSERDVESLGRKSGAALDRLFDECKAHNRMLGDSVRHAEKNSASGSSSASTSD